MLNNHEASQVVIGNTSKENEDPDAGDGICWISQQPAQLPRAAAGILSD